MSRLPQPGSDHGIWGHLLNDFLLVEHTATGHLRADGSLAAKVDVRGGGKEVVHTATHSSGTMTINLANGNIHMITLAASATVALAGATSGVGCAVSLYIKQGGAGGHTVTWPSSVKWPGGMAPVLSNAADAIDLVVLETIDGGATWFGALAGADYR